MSKDTVKIKGFSVVHSEQARILSQRSVAIYETTFSMDGAFPDVDSDFVTEAVVPLCVRNSSAPGVATAAAPGAAAASASTSSFGQQQQHLLGGNSAPSADDLTGLVAATATSGTFGGVTSNSSSVSPVPSPVNAADQQIPPPPSVPPSRALLVWPGGTNRDPRALGDSSVLRATLNSVVASNPESTVCFGVFSSTTLGGGGGGASAANAKTWTQWEKRRAPLSPRSSRGPTPPGSARGDGGYSSPNGGGGGGSALNSARGGNTSASQTPRWLGGGGGPSGGGAFGAAGLSAKEFDAFRHYRVDGQTVVGLFPLKTDSKTRVTETPKPYTLLSDVQDVLMLFHAVAHLCLSNRSAAAPDNDIVIVVDIVVATPASSSDGAEASIGGSAVNNSNAAAAPSTTPPSVFRLRYVHCMSADAVGHLVSSSSRVSLSANIAAEIFSACRVHCVLLFNDAPAAVMHRHIAPPTGATTTPTGGAATAGVGAGSSAELILFEEREAQRRKECKNDFQMLHTTRSMLTYVSHNLPAAFQPEHLLSYLGVKMLEAARAQQAAAAVEEQRAAELEQIQQQQQREEDHPAVASSPVGAAHSHPGAADAVDAGDDAAAQQQQQLQQQQQWQVQFEQDGSGVLTDRSVRSRLSSSHWQSGGQLNSVPEHLLLHGGEAEAVLRLRREVVALNDLVVDLRSRALRAEDALRDERRRSAQLQQENDLLRQRLFSSSGGGADGAAISTAAGGGSDGSHSPSRTSPARRGHNYATANAVGSVDVPRHIVDLQHQQHQQLQNRLAQEQQQRASAGATAASPGRTSQPLSARANSGIAALSRQGTSVSAAGGRGKSPLARQPSHGNSGSAVVPKLNISGSGSGAGNRTTQAPTPRAVANALDQAVRRASPAASTAAGGVGFRSEPPWQARLAVSEGKFKQTAQERRQGTAAVTKPSGGAAALRVVTTHQRPKLVTAVREQHIDDSGADATFHRTRLVRHNLYDDPHQL